MKLLHLHYREDKHPDAQRELLDTISSFPFCLHHQLLGWFLGCVVLPSFGLLNSSREQGSSKGREVCNLAFNLHPSEKHRFPLPLSRRGIEPQAAVCAVNAATAAEVLHRLRQSWKGMFLMQNLTCSITVIFVTDSILSPAGVSPDKHWNHITEP